MADSAEWTLTLIAGTTQTIKGFIKTTHYVDAILKLPRNVYTRVVFSIAINDTINTQNVLMARKTT